MNIYIIIVLLDYLGSITISFNGVNITFFVIRRIKF
jgi:hypothetical protein